MGRPPKRRLPVTAKVAAAGTARPAGPAGASKKAAAQASLKHTQALISHFHTLNKQLDQARRDGRDADVRRIEAELDAMGGLQAYQRASLKGGDLRKGWGATGKWVLPFLRAEHAERKVAAADSARFRLRLLDVGAITGETYERHAGFLDVTSIDLNSQSPKVTKQDFFERPLPASGADRFEIVCLSLVVNYVGDPAARGEMIRHSRRFLVPRGLLYIVLPLPCIANSRYLTHEHFVALVASLHLELVEYHHASKLAFYLFRRVDAAAGSDGDGDGIGNGNGGGTAGKESSRKARPTFRKQILREGGGHNNFAIVLE
ncbi:25S rRNA (adenine2142-N1)-methyltransferase [Polyrhizophydium stewartii]|uniref:25S rRNA adenine-N(1) methyltransferase n=1 Tax=Polyrhizophydium stewartii TaxID=2732419 RepID=A0ABR4N818_9FUNG|nr:hypothetical protein HK105_008325 [Polyrhizophydium stewartii]